MRSCLALVLLLGFVCSSACSTQPVENLIGIASEGETLQDVTCKSAGRCPHFLLFKQDGELLEVVDNPFKSAPGNAGPQSAELLSENGVALLVAGTVGRRMAEVLASSKIEHLEYMGKVGDALEAALKRR